MARTKREYPLDFKTMFGVSTMGIVSLLGTSMITGILLLYLTDYAGLYPGVAGRAAQVGTLLLLFGRIWDAINDPLLGYVMDRSPRTRWGKFKPYMFWGTLLSSILLIGLFNVSALFSTNAGKVVAIFVLYFLFDTAFTLQPITPLTQSLSNDLEVRTKLVVVPRIVTLLFAILTSFFLAIAVALGDDGVTPNIGLTTILFVVPLTILSLIGVAMVKEGDNNADEEQITIKDTIEMFKVNRPLLIISLASLFSGFIFTFLIAASVFYIKYAFGVENFGTQTAVWGGITLSGFIIGTLVSQVIQKYITPGYGFLISLVIAVIPLAILWVINLGGPIRTPALLYPFLFLSLLGSGMSFVPGTLMGMEAMDFNKYKLGKSMEGMISAVTHMIQKLQAALSAALTGAVLVSVGYDVALYENAASIPESLFSGLGLVMMLIPAILGTVAIGVMFYYPLLDKSKRDEMYAEIERAKAAAIS